jgi:BTB/Kelch-like protein
MDTSSNLTCDTEQFQKIYQDLLQLGAHDHERLIINSQKGLHVPCTTKKSMFDFSDLDAKSTHWVLEFLEHHMDRLVQQEHADHLFLKLESLFVGEMKMHFNKIHQIYFKAKAIRQAEKDRRDMLEAAEHKLHEIESTRLHEIETRAHDTETKLKQEIECRAHVAEDCIKQKEESIKELEIRLASLNKENNALADTLLVCRDGEIISHMKILENACFFKVNKLHIQNGMKKKSLNPEEQKSYTYKFDFKDFDFKIINAFIKWILIPATLNHMNNMDDLCELYRLADYLNDVPCEADCLVQIKKLMNDHDVLNILSSSEYPIGDGLIKACCNFAVKNFDFLSLQPKFNALKSEYLFPILQSEHLHADNEAQVLNALISWGNYQAKLSHRSLQEVLNDKINDCRILDAVRFEFLPKQQFISQVLPLKILSGDETNHWLSYYLRNESHPNQRYYALQCKQQENLTADITWNIPFKLFYSMGEWERKLCISEHFTFNNYKWKIQLGRSGDEVIIGIIVFDTHLNFDYFLELNNIRFYSSPNHQAQAQLFENNGRDAHSSIQGVHYKLKSIEENIDFSKHCLPLKAKIFIKNKA